MRVAFLTTDNRWVLNDYGNPVPHFGPAPEALLVGFAALPGIELHVVSCTRQPTNSPEKLSDNIWFHSVHVPKIGWMRTAYQGCVRAIRKKLTGIQPDIVHGQGTESGCSLEAVHSGFPNVLTLHGNMLEMARVGREPIGSFIWLAARFENYALKRTAGVFCNSKYTESRVRDRASRTWHVPNALRPAFFSAPPRRDSRSRCVFLHVGCVCENKQQIQMLELARSLHLRKLDCEFRFIGYADPASAYAQTFLNQVRLAERSGYACYRNTKTADQLITELDDASALVHTPVAEAFGLVVAEALCRDRKVFCFRVGGLPDIVQGAHGAVLAEPQDWKQLEDTIAGWLIANHPAPPPTRDLMRERYSPEQVAQRHLEIYQEVLTARQLVRP
jgi:glycosyltransferase involved in cell wall biosynthesis